MSMIEIENEIDQPDVLTRARDNIADVAKVENSDQLFGLRMHSLGWLAALHVEGLISSEQERQLVVELDETIALRRAELLAIGR